MLVPAWRQVDYTRRLARRVGLCLPLQVKRKTPLAVVYVRGHVSRNINDVVDLCH